MKNLLFRRIADVKIQFFHYFLDKRARLQDFYLIVQIVDGRMKIPKSSRSAMPLLALLILSLSLMMTDAEILYTGGV